MFLVSGRCSHVASAQVQWPSQRPLPICIYAYAQGYSRSSNVSSSIASLPPRSPGVLCAFQTALAAPLPRVHDNAPTGLAGYTEGEGQILGGMVDGSILASAGPELTRRIDAEVIAPLEKWLATYRAIKVCVHGLGGTCRYESYQ